MKLINKKTGEVKEWDFGNWYQTILNPENKEKYECSLKEYIDRVAKFSEEWCDVPSNNSPYALTMQSCSDTSSIPKEGAGAH